MTNIELCNILKTIVTDYKTLYITGCFGAPMTPSNKKRYINEYHQNNTISRRKMIESADENTFGFDCVCLIKGILWGWCGNNKDVYGGAKYQSNGVPDISTEQMLNVCTDVSNNFSSIEIGEYLWMRGHCGIYIGDGLAIECTPAWDNKVQITRVGNIDKSKSPIRYWERHGKLPYIDYVKPETDENPKPLKEFKVGDIVKFNGTKHFENSVDGNSHKTKPCIAKITKIINHPIHLICDDGTSNLYGWVDEKDIERI